MKNQPAPEPNKSRGNESTQATPFGESVPPARTVPLATESGENAAFGETAEFVTKAIGSPDRPAAGTVDYVPGRGTGPVSAATMGSGGATVDSQFAIAGYDVLGILGQGAMGVVYKARQRGLKRLVALKMISAGMHASDNERSRFRAEAEAAATLQHPNIVQVHEIGEHEGRPFICLELVTGGALDKKIAATPQPPRYAAEVVRTLALAMDHAHQHKIIHRDLKPANVLLTADGTPKIGDFGLAKSLEEDSVNTQTGAIMGTPSYMSPEQAEGKNKELGPPADIHALGAILYDLLTGRPPFRGTSVWDTVNQVKTREPVPPRQLQPSIPADLDTICLKCLQKEPAKRYASADDLAEDLRRFLAGEPIKARPVSVMERLVRWCRRNPVLAAISGAAALILIGWAISATYLVVRVSAESEEKDRQRQRAEENERTARDAQDKAEKNAETARKQHADNITRVLALLTRLNQELTPRGGQPLTVDGLKKKIQELAKGATLEMAGDLEGTGITEFGTVFAYQRLASTLNLLGAPEEAHQQYTQAVKLTRGIVGKNPDEKSRFNLGFLLNELGTATLNARGDATTALACFGEAVEINTSVLTNLPEQPANPEEKKRAEDAPRFQKDYLNKLIETAALMWDPATSRKWLQVPFDYWTTRLQANPKDASARSYLAQVHSVLGDACSWSGDWPACQKHHEAAIQLCEELIRDFPEDYTYPADVALVCQYYGDAYLRRGERDTAKKLFELHLADAERSLEHQPRSLWAKFVLANAYQRLGAMADVAGSETSVARLAKSLEFWENLVQNQVGNRSYHLALAVVLARVGKTKEAIAKADLLLKLLPKNPEVLIQAARCYVLCGVHDPAEKRKLNEKAVQLLRQAVEQGYRNTARLEREADWQPLSADTAFRKLIGQ